MIFLKTSPMDTSLIFLMMPIMMTFWEQNLLDSMNEGWNEEGNGKEKQEQGDNENRGRNFHILSKGKFAWQGVECELAGDFGLFVASGHVIAYDPREAIFDNQLGEDHVGVNILYYSNNISVVMTIWKWLLAQAIVGGYSLKQLLVSYDERKINSFEWINN